ncbi:hypothetical protein Pdw03_2639 [Penicillium digitatum]|uniref:Histone h1.3 n=1 Tax=Penicillium digitatum TaxID=36651 RepID=A0A7T7BHB6_PENDI|nr:hypothetical protein PDIDSM_4992 [Penicillium digitatum]QQK39785.1 hypothetical protein Pdw03_2639 [Penicillium digitatum]
MASPAAPKTSLFPGISATETKLLVLANVCLKNDKIDYDRLALNAGIKSSSAQTLFRNAKRKLDKLYGDNNADASGNGAQADMSPDDTPSKRGKSNAKAKAPRTPKSPKAAKTPKTPKGTKPIKTLKGGKTSIKSEEDEDQVPIKLEFDPTTTEYAENLANDSSHETAVTEAVDELAIGPIAGSAAESAIEPVTGRFAEPAATADTFNFKTEQSEEEVDKADEIDEASLDLAVNDNLPMSPLPDEADDAHKQDKA